MLIQTTLEFTPGSRRSNHGLRQLPQIHRIQIVSISDITVVINLELVLNKIFMLFIGATNYPTTSGTVGKDLSSVLQFQGYILLFFYNLQSVRTGGSLTVQEDYATNFFLP